MDSEPGIIMMCPSHHHHDLQCVSYIFVYFEQFSSKIQYDRLELQQSKLLYLSSETSPEASK